MSYIIYQHSKDIAYAMLEKLVRFSQVKKDAIHIGLSGGSTPKAVFELIAQANQHIDINWRKLHFWWCDERCVSFDDKESNFGEADRLLFRHVAIPRENLHPIQSEISPDQAAINYVQQLKKKLPLKEMLPEFDWLWLGMGEDGHTASLFVNGVSLSSDRWVEVATHPMSKQARVTLTLKVINNAKEIDFLVTGESKADMLQKVFDRETITIDYPAKMINLKEGRLVWHIEQSAARRLIWQE